ncbi:unnamed protein product [Polarella glacialis]|uniref:SET domain-containing protein n=1 Tax=Polarella glacialis TaxID=89957 RepID=A0A813DXF8_POLGL|nr:unnamed protein product [Polarella glacialis]
MTDNYGQPAAYTDFCKLPVSVQDLILGSFFCPMDSLHAKKNEAKADTNLSPSDRQRCVQFETIMNFNGFESKPPLGDGSGLDDDLDDRVGVYMVACKANHSCWPNAAWYTCDSDGTRVVRSIRTMTKGEEVLISYLKDSDLRLSTAYRQDELEKLSEFTCDCSLCSAPEDASRVFPCSLSDCPGARRAGSLGGLGDCDVCGQPLAASLCERLLADEAALQQSVDSIRLGIQDGQDMSSDVLALSHIHPLHLLTRIVARRKANLHLRHRQAAEVRAALELLVSSWATDSPLSFSQVIAFDLEFCGDSMRRFQDFVRAEELYSRACMVLAVLFEPLHPYLTCVQRKLAEVRLRLVADELEDVDQLDDESLVVLRGLPEGATPGSVGRLGAILNAEYCMVHLPDKELQVHVANVSMVSLLEWPSALGQIVLVHGLPSTSKRALNGRIGTVEGSSDGGIISVRGVLFCGGLANLRCENLVIVNSLEKAASRDHRSDVVAGTWEEEEEDEEVDEKAATESDSEGCCY